VPGAPDQYAYLERHPDNEREEGIVVLRVEGGLFFANADEVRRHIQTQARAGPRAIVLDAETVPFSDLTAAQMLAHLADDLERDGVALAVSKGRRNPVLRSKGGSR
jgi:sulfate permease, SulP family